MVGLFFKKKIFYHVLEIILLLLNLSFPISISKQYEQPSISYSYCGNIKIQTPFHHQNLNHFSASSSFSSILNQLLLCKSQKLYFRTSLGLFQISSIDYSRKLLTITNPSHSNSSTISHNFVSSKLLTSGFPPPPQPNSLVFFNCSSLPFLHIKNCSNYFNNNGYGASSSSACLVVEEYDDGKHQELLDDTKEIKNYCTHYSRMHRTGDGGFEMGTRMSFDIPDHVPNPCDECRKPHGNCGVGLRCICHLNECKDKVISSGGVNIIRISPFGGTMFSIILSFIFVMFIIIFNQS